MARNCNEFFNEQVFSCAKAICFLISEKKYIDSSFKNV